MKPQPFTSCVHELQVFALRGGKARTGTASNEDVELHGSHVHCRDTGWGVTMALPLGLGIHLDPRLDTLFKAALPSPCSHHSSSFLMVRSSLWTECLLPRHIAPLFTHTPSVLRCPMLLLKLLLPLLTPLMTLLLTAAPTARPTPSITSSLSSTSASASAQPRGLLALCAPAWWGRQGLAGSTGTHRMVKAITAAGTSLCNPCGRVKWVGRGGWSIGASGRWSGIASESEGAARAGE